MCIRDRHHTDRRVFTLRLSWLNAPPYFGKESIKDVKLWALAATLSSRPAPSYQDDMTATRTYSFLTRLIFMCMAAACIAVCGVMAAEYHGTVKTGGLPVPGVTVTAIQGDKKVVTTTDDRGVFSFAELADGTWTIEVEMLGFAKLTREVGVAHDAPAAELGLKILSEAALLASLEPGQAGPAAKPPAAEPAAAKPTPVARAAASARPAAKQQAAFQQVKVNQSADTSAITTEGAIKTEEIADLNQSAANSFIVQGSLSSAAGLPQQNDWGMGGRGMGPDGMGGPGIGGPGMGGPGGDGAGGTSVTATGGRGPGGASGGGPGGGGPCLLYTSPSPRDRTR